MIRRVGRRRILAGLAAANLVNAVAAAAILAVVSLAGRESRAQQTVPEALDPLADPVKAEALERERTFRELVEELRAKKAEIERREADISERERQVVILREELAAELEAVKEARAALARERKAFEELRAPSFERLLKAYEGMEPDNAAKALAELFRRDQMVVVDLLLGLKPRQAAAALDALAAAQPEVAAQVSYEIWKRNPKRLR
ncbi:MAG: hypothetical protein D6718_11990 [Acidobacteria bacterium]|nr:MAG: hypothetical protein D6718_11990 [Acidobacteriota bacterium]